MHCNAAVKWIVMAVDFNIRHMPREHRSELFSEIGYTKISFDLIINRD